MIDGPIIRVINVTVSNLSFYTFACELIGWPGWLISQQSCSAYDLACELIDAGEYNLTVLTKAHGKSGQIITGRWKGGYYCSKGKSPKYH